MNNLAKQIFFFISIYMYSIINHKFGIIMCGEKGAFTIESGILPPFLQVQTNTMFLRCIVKFMTKLYFLLIADIIFKKKKHLLSAKFTKCTFFKLWVFIQDVLAILQEMLVRHHFIDDAKAIFSINSYCNIHKHRPFWWIWCGRFQVVGV